MKRLLSILAFLCLALPCSAQNWTTVSASNLTDLNQNKLAAGQLCFLVTDQSDNPISVSIGGGGQSLRRGYCSPVTAGAVTAFTVPNPANTSPSGIYYRVQVKDTSTGQEVLRYAGVTFTGGTFNFDNYQPVIPGASLNPLSGNSVTGNLSVSGNESVTGVSTLTSVSTPKVNSILFVDGVTYATCAAAITAAGSVNRTIIVVPSTYAGAECPTQTNVNGIQETITSDNIEIWDLRGGNVGHTIDFNSHAQDSANNILTKLSVLNYQSNINTAYTTSAILGTTYITNVIPSASVVGGTFEVDTTGAISSNNGGIINALDGEAYLGSTGGMIADIRGVSGRVGIYRAADTTNISNAWSFYADAPINVSTSGGAITNAYSLTAADPGSVATGKNYSIYSRGNQIFNQDKGIDVSDADLSGAAHKLLRFGFSGTEKPGITYYSPSTSTGTPIYLINTEGTHLNWLFGSQFNLTNCFEITPSTALGGTSFPTPTATFCNTGISTPLPFTSTLPTGTAPFSISSTTPVANLTVQKCNTCAITNSIASYNGLATGGTGVAPNLGTPVNLTGQIANLAATTIYTTAGSGAGSAGLYRVCAAAWATSTGNSTVTINAIAPSGAGTVTAPLPQTLNTAALGNPGGGCTVVHAAASGAIQVSVTGYNTTGTYSIQAAVEQLL